jgi:hypothetical protein
MFQSWQPVQDCNFPTSIYCMLYFTTAFPVWHLFCSSFPYEQSVA